MVAGQGHSGTKIVVELLNGKKKKKKRARLAQSGESAPPLLTGTATNDNPFMRMMLLMTIRMIKRTAHPQPMNCYFCSRTLPANRLDGRQEEVGRETQICREGETRPRLGEMTHRDWCLRLVDISLSWKTTLCSVLYSIASRMSRSAIFCTLTTVRCRLSSAKPRHLRRRRTDLLILSFGN